MLAEAENVHVDKSENEKAKNDSNVKRSIKSKES